VTAARSARHAAPTNGRGPPPDLEGSSDFRFRVSKRGTPYGSPERASPGRKLRRRHRQCRGRAGDVSGRLAGGARDAARPRRGRRACECHSERGRSWVGSGFMRDIRWCSLSMSPGNSRADEETDLCVSETYAAAADWRRRAAGGRGQSRWSRQTIWFSHPVQHRAHGDIIVVLEGAHGSGMKSVRYEDLNGEGRTKYAGAYETRLPVIDERTEED